MRRQNNAAGDAVSVTKRLMESLDVFEPCEARS